MINLFLSEVMRWIFAFQPSFIAFILSFSLNVKAEANLDRENYEGIAAAPAKIKKIAAECLEPAHDCGKSRSCVYRYSSFAEIKNFKKEMLREIVQRMTDQVYGKGFRHLGVYKDFDHCHLLLGKERKPFAALCHTQERAAEHPGTEFDYVDKKSRNWMVWLDSSKKIENAMSYRYDKQPKEWNSNVTFNEYADRFTVTPFMLDPQKTGHQQTAEDIEFIFTQTECSQVPQNVIDDSNIIRIKQKDGTQMCLGVEDIPCHDRVSTCKAQCMD